MKETRTDTDILISKTVGHCNTELQKTYCFFVYRKRVPCFREFDEMEKPIAERSS